MNYKIIQDEKILKEFITWLPELKKHEKFFVALFARKKYGSHADGLLKRFIAHKGNLFFKIKQLECKLGSYVIENKIVSQDSLALYINPNPRDLKKATADVIKKGAELLLLDKNFNIQAECLSCIQRSKGEKHFIDFDIDNKNIDENILSKILKSYTIIETKGGYHVLVDSINQDNKNWYQEMIKNFNVDNSGDQLLPVPGTIQGTYMPKIIYSNSWHYVKYIYSKHENN